MSKTEIIAKGVCSYPQTEDFVKAKQYIIIEEEGERYLLVKLSNLRSEKATGVTLNIEQYGESGRKISADKVRLKNICGYPKKAFAVEHKIPIAPDCADCKITVTEAEFGGYTFTPQNLETPSYRIDPPAPVAPIAKAGAKGVKVEPRTLKMPVLLIAVSVLSLLIAFVAIAVQTSIFTRNSDSFLQNGVRYCFADGDNSDGSDIYVGGFKGNFETVNIPEKIEGHRVVGIMKNAFYGNGRIKSVTVRGSVSIGENAFGNCNALKSINLENVTEIGDDAFFGCASLEKVNLKRAERVGKNAFAFCKNLKSVIIAQDDAPITVCERAFADCTALETVEIGRIVNSDGGERTYADIFSGSLGVKELSLKSFECGDGEKAITVHDLFGVQASEGSALSLRSFTAETLDVFGYGMFANIPVETVRIGYAEKPIVRDRAFYGCKNMTELVLNEKIAEIGRDAFNGCAVRSLDGSAVESIGDGAFYGSGLETFDLTHNSALESIGAKAFEGSRLVSVYIPASVAGISPYAFANCTQLVKAEFSERSAIRFISENMFSGSNRLAEVKLPSGVGYIYGGAFRDCKALTSIELPQNLVRIYENAFYGAGLTTLTVPDSVENIGRAAFGGCESLAQISVSFIGGESGRNNYFSYIFGAVPSSLKTVTVRGDHDVSQNAFNGCSDIERVEFTGSFENMGDNAFAGCESLKSVRLPDGLKNIASFAFYNCKSLETLVIPRSVESMGYGMLSGCASVSSLTVPFVGENTAAGGTLADMYGVDYGMVGAAAEMLERISITDATFVSEGALNGCYNLREAELCDSLVNIGSYAFNGCRKLNTVHIPSGVEYIGDRAFFGCYRLYEVYNYSKLDIVAGAPDNGYVAFYALAVHGNKADKLTKVVQDGFEFVYGDGAWHLVGYPENSERIILPLTVNADGHSFDRYEIYDRLFYGDAVVKEIAVPQSVSRIGEYTFANCTALENISLSNGIASIGAHAFENCESLRSVDLPQGVTEIADGLFFGCRRLESVGAPPTLMRVGAQAFYFCAKLRDFDVSQYCAEIGDEAFYGCRSLKRFVLPRSLETIGNSAFYGCIKLYDVCNLSRLAVTAGSSAYGGAAQYAFKVSTDESVRLPYAIVSGVYYVRTDGWHAVDYYGADGETSIGEFVYDGTSVGSIAIDAYAFENNEYLESVYLGKAVTAVGENAFAGCAKLAAVSADTVNLTVMSNAFMSAPLASVSLRGGSIVLSSYAFYGSGDGLSFKFGGETATVNENAFAGCNVTRLELGGTTLNVSSYAFAQISSLESVSLDFASDVTLPARVFENCSMLSSVSLHGGNVDIAQYAFTVGSLENVSITGKDVHFAPSSFSRAPSIKLAVSGNTVTFDGRAVGSNANPVLEVSGTNVTFGQNALLCGASSVTVTASGDVEIGRNAINYVLDALSVKGDEITVAERAFEGRSVGALSFDGAIVTVGASAFTQSSVPSVSVKARDIANVNANAFADCGNLNELTVDASTFNIAEKAFYNSQLARVNVQSYDLRIGDGAFENCVGISELKLSANNSSEIGERAFNGCSQLRTLVLPASLKRIENSTFAQCHNLEILNIPASVTFIGDSAFDNCYNLRSVAIPSGVRSLGYRAFAECYVLTSLDLGSVTAVGDWAFANCGALQSLELPSTLASIGEYAFTSCSSLTSLEIPRSVTRLGSGAFSGCYSLTSLALSTADIPSYAFSGCRALTSLVIPSGVTSIGLNAFEGCESLARLDLSSSVQSIGSSAFSGCVSLGTLAVPSGVSTISANAFGSCNSLTALSLPSGLRTIEQNAFSGCNSLASLELPNGVTSIGAYAFYNCSSLASLKLPSSLTNIYTNAFENCGSLESLTIPDNVASIGSYAFSGCARLTNLKLSSSLTEIGMRAFYNSSSLTALALPSRLRSIQNYAFYGATRLFSVYNASNLDIRAGNTSNGYVAQYAIEVTEDRLYTPEFATVGDYEFVKLKSDWYLTRYMTSASSAILPSEIATGGETVTSYTVHRGAFRSALNYIMIPDAVKKITANAFSSSVRTVYYDGTESDWSSHRVMSDVDGYYNISYWNVYYYDKCAHADGQWRWNNGTPVARDIDRGEWIVTKEPTCTEDGERQSICAECGEHIYETQSVPKLGHDYDADGECTRCGHKQDLLDHDKE